MSVQIAAIEKRKAIRDKTKELLKAGPERLGSLEVLFSRELPNRDANGFINVYFLAGNVEQSRGNRDDSGQLVVRIGCRTAGDVDSDLDDLAKLVVDQLGAPVDRLAGQVDKFEEVRWEYGAPEQSTVSFLALIYQVEY